MASGAGSTTSVRLVATPVGPARLLCDAATGPVAEGPATLALGHGAAGGASSRDLVALATALPRLGVDVVRVEQPWRVAGRRVAPRPETLDVAWSAAMAALHEAGTVRGPLVVGGRSAGARVACRTGRATGAAAVLALAFPLHPPGRPDRSRRDELAAAGLAMLIVQGERDSFGRPAELGGGPWDVVAVAGADHGFAVPRRAGGPEPDWGPVLAAVASWLGRVRGE
jgi:predicted alpha/beta-hydrolase family hydrolase